MVIKVVTTSSLFNNITPLFPSEIDIRYYFVVDVIVVVVVVDNDDDDDVRPYNWPHNIEPYLALSMP
jgi:hypothetical protein